MRKVKSPERNICLIRKLPVALLAYNGRSVAHPTLSSFCSARFKRQNTALHISPPSLLANALHQLYVTESSNFMEKRFIRLLSQSHYRPEVPRGFQEVKVPRFRDNGLAQVASLTHRPFFTPRKYSWYSFLLEAESTPGP